MFEFELVIGNWGNCSWTWVNMVIMLIWESYMLSWCMVMT